MTARSLRKEGAGHIYGVKKKTSVAQSSDKCVPVGVWGGGKEEKEAGTCKDASQRAVVDKLTFIIVCDQTFYVFSFLFI